MVSVHRHRGRVRQRTPNPPRRRRQRPVRLTSGERPDDREPDAKDWGPPAATLRCDEVGPTQLSTKNRSSEPPSRDSELHTASHATQIPRLTGARNEFYTARPRHTTGIRPRSHTDRITSAAQRPS